MYYNYFCCKNVVETKFNFSAWIFERNFLFQERVGSSIIYINKCVKDIFLAKLRENLYVNSIMNLVKCKQAFLGGYRSNVHRGQSLRRAVTLTCNTCYGYVGRTLGKLTNIPCKWIINTFQIGGYLFSETIWMLFVDIVKTVFQLMVAVSKDKLATLSVYDYHAHFSQSVDALGVDVYV